MDFSTIEAVTTSHLVIGRSSAVGGSARLVDVLNQQPMLVLTESKIYPLRGRDDPVVFGVTATLSRERIIWARPIEVGDAFERNRQTTRHDRVEKSTHDVVVLAPPFQISGRLHIPDAVDPAVAAGWLARGFLPVTEASIVLEGEDKPSWECGVIAVNGHRCDVIASVRPEGVERPVSLHTFLEAS